MAALRSPTAAGRFYPAEPTLLARTVDALLAAQQAADRAPKALVAPHGSYACSGRAAAAAFAQLRADHDWLRRVVVLGPSHGLPCTGIALSSVAAFVTPLGTVAVDLDAQERVADLPQVSRREDAHRSEYSIEVQLPFLQRLLGDFPLVPLIVGEAETDDVAEVLAELDYDGGSLIVVSSDLSHYHSYAAARLLDQSAREHIESLRSLRCQDACGRTAINGLLAYARARGWRARTLALTNSGEDGGDKSRVVGYGAFAFLA